ncbi:hypothetical protein DFH09DRAFT_1336112 [Mycena vulgaris]|nr:hypothetical protein DFH09DRAFT_1336112 [Mycena vulgaris]
MRRPRAPRSASSASSSSCPRRREQHLSLFYSFRSVKFERSDLDGMRSVRRRYNSPLRLQLHHTPSTPAPQQPAPTCPQAPAFAVLTNARLVAFSADDTICVRRSASSSTLLSSPALSPPPTPTPHARRPRADKNADEAEESAHARPRPLRLLSPLSPCALGAIRVPRPPLAVCARIDTSHSDHSIRTTLAIPVTSGLEP